MTREIRCGNSHSRGGICGRFLAKLERGRLYLYCPKCQGWHVVTVAELVRLMQLDIENFEAEQRTLERREAGDGDKLLL